MVEMRDTLGTVLHGNVYGLFKIANYLFNGKAGVEFRDVTGEDAAYARVEHSGGGFSAIYDEPAVDAILVHTILTVEFVLFRNEG